LATLPTYYSLSKILSRVKTIIDNNIEGKYFWLKVEITSINFHRSGHTYIELAENSNGKTVAKCKAIIWNQNTAQIRKVLGPDFSNILKKGNEILCYTHIQFDAAHGLSLLITDINLEFAVGQIEKKRQETLDRLKKEGIIDLNKEIKVPLVISNIAVIASENTSGYQDFIKNIQDNQYKYKYNLDIFSSAVQGNAAELEILKNLKIINKQKYDCVVIIRGGGSKMDLDVFNSYKIAKQISKMQTAVFSGIGHETDSTVIDFAANHAFKTPTEVSNYIVNKSYDFEQKILRSFDLIYEKYQNLLARKFSELILHTEGIVNASNGLTRLRRGALHTLMNRFTAGASYLVNEEKNTLSAINQEQLQQSKRIVHNKERFLKKQLEMLGLRVAYLINNKKTYLSNSLILLAASSTQTILNKGFAIPRLHGKPYNGEPLTKDTIIKLEFKDTTILTKYVKQED
jgi:exodeoxyribonuclease VII large subunit